MVSINLRNVVCVSAALVVVFSLAPGLVGSAQDPSEPASNVLLDGSFEAGSGYALQYPGAEASTDQAADGTTSINLAKSGASPQAWSALGNVRMDATHDVPFSTIQGFDLQYNVPDPIGNNRLIEFQGYFSIDMDDDGNADFHAAQELADLGGPLAQTAGWTPHLVGLSHLFNVCTADWSACQQATLEEATDLYGSGTISGLAIQTYVKGNQDAWAESPVYVDSVRLLAFQGPIVIWPAESNLCDGASFNTIQAASGCAAPGASIAVPPGTYAGTVVIAEDDITLMGTTGNPNDVVLDAGSNDHGILVDGVNGFTLRDMTVLATGGAPQGTGNGEPYGVRVSYGASHGLTIDNAVVAGGKTGVGIIGDDADGVFEGVTITDSHVTSTSTTTGGALTMDGFQDVSVTNSVLEGGYANVLMGDGGGDGVVFHDNVFTGAGTNTIYVYTMTGKAMDFRFNDWGFYDPASIAGSVQDNGNDLDTTCFADGGGGYLDCIDPNAPARVVSTLRSYYTISDALAAASAGDTIAILTGTGVQETLAIGHSSLTLCQGNAAMTACGSDPDDVIIDGSGNAPFTLEVNAPDVTIEGVTIQNSGLTGYGGGIRVNSQTGFEAHNVKLLGNLDDPNNYQNGAPQGQQFGIVLAGASTGYQIGSLNAADENEIRDWSHAGVLAGGGTIGQIQGTSFVGEMRSGILSQAQSPGSLIEGNSFQFQGIRGMNLENANGVTVRGNDFLISFIPAPQLGGGTGIYMQDGQDHVVADNTFVLQSGSAISFDWIEGSQSGDLPQGVVVQENTFDLPSGVWALFLDGASAAPSIDARFNHWGAFRNDTIHSTRISGPSANVDVGCFYAIDGADQLCPPLVNFGYQAVAQNDWPKTVFFQDQTSYPDSSMVSREWTFLHDGSTSDVAGPDKRYYEAGLYDVRLDIVDSLGYRMQETKSIAVLADQYRFSLTPNFQGLQDVSPGQNVTFAAVVENLGLEDDTYGISVANTGGWTWYHAPTVFVASGDAATIVFNTTVPEGSAFSEPSLVVSSFGNGKQKSVYFELHVPAFMAIHVDDVVYEGESVGGWVTLTFADGTPAKNHPVSLDARHVRFTGIGLRSLASLQADVTTDDSGRATFTFDPSPTAPLFGLRGLHEITIQTWYGGSQFTQAHSYIVRPAIGL